MGWLMIVPPIVICLLVVVLWSYWFDIQKLRRRIDQLERQRRTYSEKCRDKDDEIRQLKRDLRVLARRPSRLVPESGKPGVGDVMTLDGTFPFEDSKKVTY